MSDEDADGAVRILWPRVLHRRSPAGRAEAQWHNGELRTVYDVTNLEPETLPISPTWPVNTAAAPDGWQRLVDVDGSEPEGWFSTTNGRFRTAVRGTPGKGRVAAFYEEDLYLRNEFEFVLRAYRFPDADDAGPATHSFANLDFCGGWQPAVRTEDDHLGFAPCFARTLDGLKPASERVFHDDEVYGYRDAAEDYDLFAQVWSHFEPDMHVLWICPVRLSDLVDPDALHDAWQALVEADPDRDRAAWVMRQAYEGLRRAFRLDLSARPVLRASSTGHGMLTQPWWDEESPSGVVTLGAILGYPPASTYAMLSEWIA